MKKSIITTTLLLCVLTATAFAEDYQISMLPRYYPERLTAMMMPLTEYLSDQTGASLEFVLTDNFADYEKQIKKGRIAIGYQNPLVYARVSEVHQVLAMASKGEDGDKFRGIVIARPDSPVKSLADLAGKTVMIVSKTSAGGYLSQKLSLLEQQMSLNQLEVEVAADNRQENVIISVSVGDVDAGFIRESAFHIADQYIMPGSVRIVTETAWLPNWAFSVDKDMDAELQMKLRAAVTELSPDHPVLQAMGLKGFRPAEDSDYDVMRALLADED